MKMKMFLTLLMFGLGMYMSLAQTNFGTLKGRVVNSETDEPLAYTHVVLMKNNVQKYAGVTDEDGYYTLKPIAPGTYDVVYSYAGQQMKKVVGLIISSNKITFNDQSIVPTIKMKTAVIEKFVVPLVDRDRPTGNILTAKDIKRSAIKDINAFADLSPGVINGSFQGQRLNGNAIYIDGMKVRGQYDIPMGSIAEIQTITSGIPAEYGDITGGVIIITTRKP